MIDHTSSPLELSTIENREGHFLAQELVPLVQQALDLADTETVLRLLDGLHAADVAKVIQYLRGPVREGLIQCLRHRMDPEVLARLDETVREEVIALLKPEELAAALSDLESDDAFSVIEDLDHDQKLEILGSIALEDRVELEEVFNYPPSSAGRLMQREVAIIPDYWNVGNTLQYLSKAHNLPEVFYDIFVVDSGFRPLGVVPISKLLKTPASVRVSDIMREDIHQIPTTMDQEDVALVFRQYSLVSAPVVNVAGCVVGMITVDDVVEVIDEEAKEDIMHLAGVSESDFYAPVWSTSLARIQWLAVTLMNTLLAAMVVYQFQDTLSKKVALAICMPIVASIGGNSGMQVMTVAVRALATRELGSVNMTQAIVKEFLVASIIGVFFSLIIGTISALWFHELSLGLVLGAAMIFNMLWAGIAGITVPIIIARLGKDPALSAGPLLTTTTDVLGFSIFLGLSSFFLVH